MIRVSAKLTRCKPPCATAIAGWSKYLSHRKALLATRPIFHKYDQTIRGHIFCSFLALVLRKELEDRLLAAGHDFEWADIVQDPSG